MLAALLALAFGCAAATPALAARPLLDSGKWDAYFALFARDAQVPWKRISVRLDTYSGAPVDFAAYEADPADVIVAGSNARPRAIDTAHRTPVARWRFTPPPGLKFEANDVEVPLANREGFYVIEARRGDATQQVWLDLSRIGLLTKESAGGITMYGADLGTGRRLAGMRVTFLVGTSFVYGRTNAAGVALAPAGRRPRFALAEWGRSKAFVTFVPVSPVPAALVGLRLERGVVRAGERLRAIGFVRRRVGASMRPAGGEVKVAILTRGRTLATAAPKLDAAGAFVVDLVVPAGTAAGDVAVLATSNGATGGATLTVDGAGTALLTVKNACGDACAPDAALPVTVTATNAGLPLAGRDVRVRVVRTPHVLAPGASNDAPQWATTTIIDSSQKTDANGNVTVSLPAPTDGLASTYGITAASGNATATGRIVTPTAKIALAVAPERATIDIGQSATVDVRGFDALAGTPAAGLAVHVQLVHGPNVQDQTVQLDADGRGSATFHNPIPGTDLATADATVDGKRAFDASAITVAPSALGGTGSAESADVHVTLDKPRYRVHDTVRVSATLAGAAGDALVTLDGARSFAAQTVGVRDGRASAAVTIPETVGDVTVGVAFVRDGAVYYATQRLVVDGPGHDRATALSSDKPVYAPGSVATIAIHDGDIRGAATVAVRLLDGRPATGAAFEDAPGVLAAGGTTSQDLASDDPGWHAWVAPARSTAGDVFAFDRPRPSAVTETAIAPAVPRALVWNVERRTGGDVDVTVPAQAGTYVLSVLKITDDGDVGAATISLRVQ